MCGIAGCINLKLEQIGNLDGSLNAMSRLMAHRGPDGEGTWMHSNAHVGLAHRRLSIIDLSANPHRYIKNTKREETSSAFSFFFYSFYFFFY